MSEQQVTFNGDTEVLFRQAVRTPLPNEEAERVFYENMMNVADAQEQKADMLADPDVSLLEAYETQLEGIAASYKRRCRHIAGDDYEDVAQAYQRGERTDRVGALTAYYFEGLWRMQQRITVTDMLFFPVILRYPDSFTVNIRFASGYKTTDSVLYESPEHSREELDDKYAETYYNESLYSQKEAAEYIRDTAQIIREEFQDPDEVPFEERKYGGIVSAGGRKGSVFSSMLQRVDTDPDRFSEPVDQPTLVDEGREAARTERELLPDGSIVI
ncbi:hypothetical protein GJR96_07775 [Haloferax sp. MBLA0076]|uniref:Uncharacterized protein n=1 Tax=Haloferax litoreum TaxID=2666140 RepID=A0A6A8GEN5_9EURY|nr:MULTISPECIES: hypothetical protein [Haloferax]KAB1193346.1 hypothetical protein Hfx1148_07765 [Haloferax sp. CBA1148]MRX21854.1 hypothetical protein [Haloferax litoreum]